MIEPAGRRRGTPPPAVYSPGLVGEVGGQSGPGLPSPLVLVYPRIFAPKVNLA